MKVGKKVKLTVLGVVLAAVFFVLGYGVAVFVSGADGSAGLGVAAVAGGESRLVRDAVRSVENTAIRAVRSPSYAIQRPLLDAQNTAMAQLPPPLRHNTQINMLVRSSGLTPQARVNDYNRALSSFERDMRAASRSAQRSAFDGRQTGGGEAAGQASHAAAAAGPKTADPEESAGADAAEGTTDSAPEDEVAEAPDEAAETRRRHQPLLDAQGESAAYALEVASFLSQDKAESFAAALGAEGTATYLVEKPDAWGRLWLHVRIGPYPSYAAAEKMGQLIASRGFRGVVVRDNSYDTGNDG